MKVNVYLSEAFRKYASGNAWTVVDINGRQTPVDILEILRIPSDEVGFVTVNGKRVDFDFLLNDNDKIRFYTMIIGG